jgi:sugar phosphate isomerase/epimerase
MPQPSSIDKFFGAVDDAYDIILDTLKAGVDRRYRVSKGLIDQAQAGQQEAVELAATIAQSPTSLASASGAVVQTLTGTQGRVLELSRQWLDEAMDARQEGREALRRMIDANRQAGQAVVESSRGLAGRAQERARQIVRPRRGGNSAKAEGEARPRRKARAGGTKSE